MESAFTLYQNGAPVSPVGLRTTPEFKVFKLFPSRHPPSRCCHTFWAFALPKKRNQYPFDCAHKALLIRDERNLCNPEIIVDPGVGFDVFFIR
jgi:hypothetical protein